MRHRARVLALACAAIALAVAAIGQPAMAETRKPRHVSIPALGISKDIHVFPCDRTRPPDDFVYVWGCAGERNVYLLGHAASVFEPLHDAYVSGRLRQGMRVLYRDEAGVDHAYRVTWWRLTTPTPDARWAWAPLGRSGMTLQTCVGKDNEYRLMVRLYEGGSPLPRFRGKVVPASG